jgi:hypothetical protein
LVKGSHGLAGVGRAAQDWPVLIGTGPAPAAGEVAMAAVRDLVLAAIGVPSPGA